MQSAYTLLSAYAAWNPHAQFTLQWYGQPGTVWPATNRAWEKWGPQEPTSPHWYTPEHLRALIAAKLAVEQSGGPAATVREFVSEFRGLSGSVKPKAVTTRAGLAGAYLHDLIEGNDVALAKVTALLAAMQAEARVVKPVALGVLGEAHLRQYLEQHHYVQGDSIRYKRVLDVDKRGVPFVLEVGFGLYRAEYAGCGRTIESGVNWSPTLTLPFREMPFLLGEARADRADPVVLAAHLACPRVEFTDRGKGVLAHAS